MISTDATNFEAKTLPSKRPWILVETIKKISATCDTMNGVFLKKEKIASKKLIPTKPINNMINNNFLFMKTGLPT